MKSKGHYSVLACLLLVLSACYQEVELIDNEPSVAAEIIEQVAALGFNPDGIERVDEGYRVEGDIILTYDFLRETPPTLAVPNTEQYRTTNLVDPMGQRVITVYMKVGDRGGFTQTASNALNEAIRRYNDEPLNLTFVRVNDISKGDIVFNFLSAYDENRGVVASAGFPTAAGDPYPEIKLNNTLNTRYGFSMEAIASVVAHEIGHCIGFRHTDYFNRSISCGGGIYHEGSGSYGAHHIPGTPYDATLEAASWMLSCTNGTNRPFNADDKVALFELYGLRVSETGY